MVINKFYNEDCFVTMERMYNSNVSPNIILTSPPYNTARRSTSEKARENRDARYDVHIDNMTDDGYLEWTVDIFNTFDITLAPNGVVLYNMSYSTDVRNKSKDYNPNELMWRVVNDIIMYTPFTIGDCIVWKKSNALPNNSSKNKLTRIVEYVFVFVRESEFLTYNSNKQVKSVSKSGQKFYNSEYNFIEARNNDGSNKLNKATYSTQLCNRLLELYGKQGDLVYDPFMGTGTTAVSALQMGMNFIGSEISENQVLFSNERIANSNGQI